MDGAQATRLPLYRPPPPLLLLQRAAAAAMLAAAAAAAGLGRGQLGMRDAGRSAINGRCSGEVAVLLLSSPCWRPKAISCCDLPGCCECCDCCCRRSGCQQLGAVIFAGPALTAALTTHAQSRAPAKNWQKQRAPADGPQRASQPGAQQSRPARPRRSARQQLAPCWRDPAAGRARQGRRLLLGPFCSSSCSATGTGVACAAGWPPSSQHGGRGWPPRAAGSCLKPYTPPLLQAHAACVPLLSGQTA